MNYRIIYTPSYNKKAARFLKKHPDLYAQYEKTLKLLEIDVYHPSLRLHKLKGSLSKLSSVSINISYRISLELLVQDDCVILVDVGSHDEVYG
jgi:mRNA-degrading endonuclease YafQ of YafQ-DinJ toxin-antitoxin module